MTQEPTLTINADGTKIWYLNGKCHRVDGPAVEWANGTKEWYLNGKENSFKECSRVAKLAVGTDKVCDAIEEHFGVEE